MSVPFGNIPLLPATAPAGDNSKKSASTEYVDRAATAAVAAALAAVSQANIAGTGLSRGRTLALALTN